MTASIHACSLRALPRIILSLAVLLTLVATPASSSVDPDLLAGVSARSIGPATMSGRVGAVTALPSDPETIYVGAASGGVWKSTDGGATWAPIFDEEKVASIGAIAIHSQAPDVVWVGTGEGNPRNSASVGYGVYKSVDGGETWTHLGLEGTEKIHRVVLHPHDPDVAWVAALGSSWKDSTERGVFKTTDGGATWTKVLYVNETTGASHVEIDPDNPHHLLASMWDHRRWPWFFRSGGPGSGLYSSRDGGETWTQLTPEDGLPEGELGRIGLAFAPSDASRVYALVEAEGDDNLLLRSDDGGRSWRTVAKSSEGPIGNRPFYYSDLVVDPQDPNRVYSLWSLVSRSVDGGEDWQVIIPFAQAHPDHHSMWISPSDPNLMYLGNDGGVYVSRDRGASWQHFANLPFAQLYHVRVDDQTPFRVFFGLQDNGSWVGPSETWDNGGIRNHHWQEIYFGDGFDAVPDPANPCCGWAMSQQGYLGYWNLDTGASRLARPEAPPGQKPLRYNWNAPVALDPFDPNVVYFGSQYVHRSTDHGRTWDTISGDLTSNNEEWQKQAESGGLTLDVTGAENFVTLLTIAPSPVEQGVIWTGSDDGRIHVTRDGGTSWTSVEANVKGVPDHSWIPHIEPSRFDGGEAFVVYDDHRRGNWTPYVYRTRDYGATWTRLADGDDLWGYTLSVAQDPKERDMLYVGTEFGLWITPDAGETWVPFRHGVPTTSVMDLAIQERHDALVLGTHGRGVFVVDDLEPLRQVLVHGQSGDPARDPMVLATPSSIQHVVAQTSGSRFPGDGEFRGENPPRGASIYVWLGDDSLPHPDEDKERERKAAERDAKKAESSDAGAGATEGEDDPANEEAKGPKGPKKLSVTVLDAEGETLREMETSVHQGLNRVVWDYSSDPFDRPGEDGDSPFNARGGPEVPPGTYYVKLTYGDQEMSTQVEVQIDPRLDGVTADDLARRFDALRWAGALQETTTHAIRRVERTRADIETVLAKLAQREEAEKDDEAQNETVGDDDADEAANDEESQSPEEALKSSGEELKKTLDELMTRLQGDDGKGIRRNDDAVFPSVRQAFFVIGRTWEAPPPVQLNYLDRAEATLADVLPEINRVASDDVAAFREQVEALDIRLLPPTDPIEMPEDPQE